MLSDPITALSAIYQLGKMVHVQAEMAKANEKLCKRLSQQVDIIIKALKGLENLPRSQHFMDALQDINQLLQQSIIYIGQFSKEKKWSRIVKLCNAGDNFQKYQNLNQDLEKRAQLLNLGFGAQQLVNLEADKKALQSDIQALQAQNNEIIQLILSENKPSVNQLNSNEKRYVDTLQEESIQEALTTLNHPNEKKKPLIDPKISVDFYELIINELLTDSESGRIYAGVWSRVDVAIKMIEAASNLTEHERQSFAREVKIMSSLRHPNIVAFYGACLEKSRACLVMEKLERGTLYSMIERRESFSEYQRLTFALDIAKALEFLHQRKILHRGLTSENVWIDTNGHAKISDFGLSKISNLSVRTAKNTSLAWQWLAPEMMLPQANAEAESDIYSYGIILWEIYSGEHPYSSKKITPQEIINGVRQQISTNTPKPIADLIQRCWSDDMNRRPYLDEIITTLGKQLTLINDKDKIKHLEEEAQRHYDQKDEAHAFQTWTKAAVLGSVIGNSWCGFFYLTGRGGASSNKQTAFTYLTTAAEGGDGRAQYNLARMLEKGDGVSPDKNRAIDWYQKAKENKYEVMSCEQKLNSLQSSHGNTF